MRDNLALGRPATQSSVSVWSSFPTTETDARGANNGLIDGEAGFHTDKDVSPWWQVDLQATCVVDEVAIFNRQHCAFRLRRFSILASLDGARWVELFRKTDNPTFGDKDLRPYIALLPEGSVARFLRIRLDDTEHLHFCECQVFGQIVDAASALLLEARFNARLTEQKQDEQRREAAMLEGRRGKIAKIGDHVVFIDTEHYSPTLIKTLDDGSYEARERVLVSNLLDPDDRVLEIGTAVGVIAMTAAKIVGPGNVVTFDANPQIVADAQRNFAYAGLSAIRAQIGVLQNRRRFANTPALVDFFVSRDFWASRLSIGDNAEDIVDKVSVPTSCLEEQIADHRATVIICDIEGGEIDLLIGANLAGIRLLIIEVHDWSVGQHATDAMMRYLIVDGFNVDLYSAGNGIAVLRR